MRRETYLPLLAKPFTTDKEIVMKNALRIGCMVASFFITANFAQAECTDNATVADLPVDGAAVDLCIKGEYHIVASAKSFVVTDGTIPASFAEDMAVQAASLKAKQHLQEFIQSGKFKTSRLYEEALKQTFGTEAAAEGGVDQKNSYSYELEGRAIAGAFVLRNKKDKDFVSVTYAVSESSMQSAKKFQALNQEIIDQDKSSLTSDGGSDQPDGTEGASKNKTARSYSSSTPDRDWVNPNLLTQ
jgi:hypothetical protein